MFTVKLSGKYRGFPYVPSHKPHVKNLPTINIPSGTFQLGARMCVISLGPTLDGTAGLEAPNHFLKIQPLNGVLLLHKPPTTLSIGHMNPVPPLPQTRQCHVACCACDTAGSICVCPCVQHPSSAVNRVSHEGGPVCFTALVSCPGPAHSRCTMRVKDEGSRRLVRRETNVPFLCFLGVKRNITAKSHLLVSWDPSDQWHISDLTAFVPCWTY